MFLLQATYGVKYFEFSLTSLREVKAAIATLCEDVLKGYCQCFQIVSSDGCNVVSCYANDGMVFNKHYLRSLIKTSTIKSFAPLKGFKALINEVCDALKSLAWYECLPQSKGIFTANYCIAGRNTMKGAN